MDNQQKLNLIVEEAIKIADDPKWQEEINRLPSGRKGFIYLAVEDALNDWAGYMSYDGKTFTYDGPSIPDVLVPK